MNKICAKWKDQLLEAALGKKASNELEAHLSQCSDCTAELAGLRARSARLDALLTSLAGAKPSADLTNRILAAIGPAAAPEHALLKRRWMIVTAAAVIVIAVLAGWILKRHTNVLDPVPPGTIAMAHWQAPSDVLLQVPNHDLLNSVPKLDDSYLQVPVEQKGEKQ